MMFWFVFASLYYALLRSGMPVAGQCTSPYCAASVSGSEESLLESLEDHDKHVKSMLQDLSSRFNVQKSSNFGPTNQGKEQMQKLEAMHQNLSSTLQTVKRGVDEKLQERNEQLSSRLGMVTGSVVGALKDHDQKLQTINKTLSSAIQLMNEQVTSRLGLMNGRVVSALAEQDQTFRVAIEKVNEKLNAILDHVNENLQYIGSRDNCRNSPVVCDCSEIKRNGQTTSGVYRIYVVHQYKRYYATAYCDMTTANSGWTVFQRRKDGSVDFYRDWKDYAHGFGNPKGEFWLGNNFLHLLTSKRRYQLRVDLEDFEGENRYAQFSTFNISSSEDKYRLTVSGYSGTAGDSLTYHNGYQFTTKDNDNDNDADAVGNCAIIYRGAWWYNTCYQSSLNGLYIFGQYNASIDSSISIDGRKGIRWNGWHNTHTFYSLKTSEMKICPY